MEAADLRKLHYLSELRRLYPPRDRSILVERQVSASPLVVFEIRLQDATQARFMQDDDVVQALAANRADQALDIGILPRRLRSGEDISDAQPPCRFVEFLSVAAVANREADSGAHCPKGKLPAVAGWSIPPWDSRLQRDE